LIVDRLGNQILCFTLRDIPPFGTRIIRIGADLLLSEAPRPMPAGDLQHFLRPETYCESDDPGIGRLSGRLKARDRAKTAENIFHWVSNHVKREAYARRPRGARVALQRRKGDCTEFMYLFAALCRAGGIPARAMGGYASGTSAVLRPGAYHNWVEFYEDGLWQTADPHGKIFKPDEVPFVAFQVLGGPEKNPVGDFRRFRVEGEGVAAVMNGPGHRGL
jgi:transglutaminase-like putative cysteine protease